AAERDERVARCDRLAGSAAQLREGREDRRWWGGHRRLRGAAARVLDQGEDVLHARYFENRKPVFPPWSTSDHCPLSVAPITRTISPFLTVSVIADDVVGLARTFSTDAVTVASCGETSTNVSFLPSAFASTLPSTVGVPPTPGAVADDGASPMSSRMLSS